MHSLAAQLPSAGRLLTRAGQGGDPRSQRGPETELAALPRTKTSMPTVAPYLRKDADWAATRRMTAGAAAETAVVPLAGLLAARGLPPADPRDRHATDPVLGAVCTSATDALAAATHAEPEISSGQRDHETAGQHARGMTWPPWTSS